MRDDLFLLYLLLNVFYRKFLTKVEITILDNDPELRHGQSCFLYVCPSINIPSIPGISMKHGILETMEDIKSGIRSLLDPGHPLFSP